MKYAATLASNLFEEAELNMYTCIYYDLLFK